MKTVEEYKTVLKENIANVVFTKADGSERKMRCTLDAGYLPAVEATKSESAPKKQSTEAVAVWDLDAEGWRSFRIDSVKTFSTEA